MRVHDLDDRHRPHQEEGDLRSTHQGFAELVGDDVMVARAEGVDRPQQAGTNERRGRLVDLERVLERDRRVGDDKTTIIALSIVRPRVGSATWKRLRSSCQTFGVRNSSTK